MAGAKENQVKSLKVAIVQEFFTAQIAFVLSLKKMASIDISQVQINLGNCRWGKQGVGSGMNLLCFWSNKQTDQTRIKDEIRSLGRVDALGRT